MIKISTQELNSLFLENKTADTSSVLNQEEESFYISIKSELNREVRHPHPSTIDNILAHSKKLSK